MEPSRGVPGATGDVPGSSARELGRSQTWRRCAARGPRDQGPPSPPQAMEDRPLSPVACEGVGPGPRAPRLLAPWFTQPAQLPATRNAGTWDFAPRVWHVRHPMLHVALPRAWPRVPAGPPRHRAHSLPSVPWWRACRHEGPFPRPLRSAPAGSAPRPLPRQKPPLSLEPGPCGSDRVRTLGCHPWPEP